jgi:hypothetical protein
LDGLAEACCEVAGLSLTMVVVVWWTTVGGEGGGVKWKGTREAGDSGQGLRVR